MVIMDSEQDSEHLSKLDYHNGEHNSVLLVLRTYIEVFLKEKLMVVN